MKRNTDSDYVRLSVRRRCGPCTIPRASISALVLIVVALLLRAAAPVGAQGPAELSIAPPNPAFVQHQEALAEGKIRPQAAYYGRPLGLIPPVLDRSHLKRGRVQVAPMAFTFPEVYDLRTLGRVTPVKDQEACGSCWAFACYGSLESCLLPTETCDFSENNLKNEHGFDPSCCSGGWFDMTTAYLARWAGPVWESDDPYEINCYSPPGLSARKHVQEVIVLPERSGPTDNALIKQEIVLHGGVSAAFLWVDGYYNSATYAYRYAGTSRGANHAICLVGWDDGFSRTKFRSVPPGNGAFIAKNSWGRYFGNQGYFYISYYDSTLSSYGMAVYLNAEAPSNYDQAYQYDPLGWCASVGYGTTTTWFANVFTAEGNENLAAVSFHTAAYASSYEVYVHLNPTSGPLNPAGPAASQTGDIYDPGYHTVALDSTVQLAAGQRFSVVVKLTTPGYRYPAPVEYPISGYSSDAQANPGESYISPDGVTWSDLAEEFYNTNACLKAFTAGLEKVAKPMFDPDGGAYAEAQNVTISCATPDAVVHYTTNGATPTEEDLVASDPVTVDRTLTLKARAFLEGWTPSEVKSANYIIGGENYLTVTITYPTRAETYQTGRPKVDLAGTAYGPDGVSRAVWSNNRGGSGTCLGTTSWRAYSIPLASGANVITVTAYDANGFSGRDTLTVTFVDTTPPTVRITRPTTGRSYSTRSSTLNMAGTAYDNVGVTDVSWSSSTGASGACTGTTSWRAAGIPLLKGTQVITITAHDAAGNPGTATLMVRRR